MRTILVVLSVLFIATSCGNNPKNKVEGTDAQAVAVGAGEKLTVDTIASLIEWTGSKPGGSHHGTIAIKDGQLTLEGTEVTSGSFTIDMNSIVDIDLTDAEMNKMLVDHLKSADFFDVAKYSESKFTITKIEPASTPNDSVTHVISGNLKMKDVEKNISFDAKITKEDNVYKAVTVPFSIDRTQWNVQYASKSIFPAIKDKVINDNIDLKITIVAKAE